MGLQRTYYGAKSCTGSSRPGAKALMSWWLGAYGSAGAKNLGIYNCRVIDGSSTLSLHAEGRACDLGTPPGNSWSWTVVDWMRLNSLELGVQLIIHNRKVWSARQPDAGWRTYTGSNPHTDHGHVELTPDAAANLTVARINEIAGGAPADGDDMFCKQGDTGPKVTYLQLTLIRAGVDLSAVGGADGVYGPGTAAGLAQVVTGDGATFGPAEADKLLSVAYGGPGPASFTITGTVSGSVTGTATAR